MQPRIKSPALTLPGTREALLAIHKTTQNYGVPAVIVELVNIRVGQINGCSVCVDMHCRAMKKLGESDTRICMVSAWREASYYTDAERAALGLAEAMTRIADRPDAVPDAVWKEASAQFSDEQLAALVMMIAQTNLWNRLNVATRQITGEWVAQYL